MRNIWNRSTGILITAAALTFFLAATPAFSGNITVTSSADSGPGSLRDAIDQANPGFPIWIHDFHTIQFGYGL